MSIIDVLLAGLAPYECLSCTQEGNLVCDRCLMALPAGGSMQLGDSLGSIWSATPYTGLAKQLVWCLKSSGVQAAAKVMASRMALELPRDAVLVPVPTATSRVRARGYDQSKLLARAVARRQSLPVLNCLARHGQTHQVGATRQQRLSQLSTAFRVIRPARLAGRHVILVDDVTTTGATLELAAQKLLAAGARRVDAVTFAHTAANTAASQ